MIVAAGYGRKQFDTERSRSRRASGGITCQYDVDRWPGTIGLAKIDTIYGHDFTQYLVQRHT
jgi:hypothetical protein